jgi:hypothetical protein
MKALISPLENDRICQVENDADVFEVAEPLFWTTCPDNCTVYWTYAEGQFIEPQPKIPTAIENGQTAISLLQQTDWTSVADVGNPQLSNPYLSNQAEFISWRSQVRAIAVSPIAGILSIFDEMPLEVWKSV